MNLKPRPMSEAPLNKTLLLWLYDKPYNLAVIQNEQQKQNFCSGWQGFICLPDLLRAAEIVAAITPEGYEYEADDLSAKASDDSWISRTVYFRRIAPPVEYEYVTDGKRRQPRVGDVLAGPGDSWIAVTVENVNSGFLAQRCYRRVEVAK